MGATRHPRDGTPSFVFDDESRAPPPIANSEELTLPLDPEELRMLEIFHKSFNLPGLRLGLVRPVADDDYYPPDHEEDDDQEQPPPAPPPQQHREEAYAPAGGSRRAGRAAAAASRPAYEEPDASAELHALLQQTRAMRLDVGAVLDGEAPTIDDEAIGEELHGGGEPAHASAHLTHQRQVLRPGSRPSSSAGTSSKPSSVSGRARPRRW